MKLLYKNVIKNFKVNYILTYKLHQDSVENIFSQIRGMGHQYGHPTPVEASNRLRLILLSKNLSQIKFSKNIIADPINEIIVSSEFCADLLYPQKALIKKFEHYNHTKLEEKALFTWLDILLKCEKFSFVNKLGSRYRKLTDQTDFFQKCNSIHYVIFN